MQYPQRGGRTHKDKFLSRPTHSYKTLQAFYTALKNTTGLDSSKVNSPGEVGQILSKLKYLSFSVPAAPFSHCPIAHLLTALPRGVSTSPLTYTHLQAGDFRAIKPTQPLFITMPRSHILQLNVDYNHSELINKAFATAVNKNLLKMQ